MTHNPSPTCDNCGSVDVYRKRLAYYAPAVEAWLDDPFCDEYHCNRCGNENVDMSAWFGSVKKVEASA